MSNKETTAIENKTTENMRQGLKVKVSKKNGRVEVTYNGNRIVDAWLSSFDDGRVFGSVVVWDIESAKPMETSNGIKGVYVSVKEVNHN